MKFIQFINKSDCGFECTINADHIGGILPKDSGIVLTMITGQEVEIRCSYNVFLDFLECIATDSQTICQFDL